ncbi:hypothetical protein [Nocardioides sp. NPDC127503]|uniref:hypothetical protein n=1 Tax=Nocardioides sp. NPDC127503 TaxID=3154516 RepID=UPI003328DEDB
MKLDGQRWRMQTSHVRLGNQTYRVVRPARPMQHAPLHTTSWNGAEICLDKPTAVELACAWWLAARSPRTLIHLPLRESPRECGTWAKRRRLDLLLLHHSLAFPPSRWKEVRTRARLWHPHTITLPKRPFREITAAERERTYWHQHRDTLRSTIAAETLVITGSRPAFELEGDGIAKLAQEAPADIAAQPDVHVCTELDIEGIWHGLHIEICQTHR